MLRGGIENVNQAEAKARGVEVMNTPGRNARSVAEFTVGMILAEMRNIARSHDALRDKFWRKESLLNCWLTTLERTGTVCSEG